MADKQFYHFLDGLRGFAAVAVLFYHLGHWSGGLRIFQHGYLAVDFFFCLSGFVISHAYTTRLSSSMSLWDFVKIRTKRLYPMIFLSVAVAGTYMLARSFIDSEGPARHVIALGMASGFTLVPYLNAPASIGGPLLYPINGPLWSLFLEMIANVFWAATAGVMRVGRLIAIAAICACLLAASAHFFGHALTGDKTGSFLWGIPRAIGTLSLGVVAHRLHESGRLRLNVHPGVLLGLLLIILWVVPPAFHNAIDILLVLIVFPLMVLAGANVQVTGKAAALSLLSGRISYPLYLMHFPLFQWLNGSAQILGVPRVGPVYELMLAGLILIGSWVSLIMFDEPVRRRMKRA